LECERAFGSYGALADGLGIRLLTQFPFDDRPHAGGYSIVSLQ